MYQTNSNILVALKREASIGVAAGAAGGTQMRITDSPGLELSRAQIQSAEKRADLLKTMGRLGGKSVSGSYNSELTVGGATDLLFESILRNNFAAILSTALGATDGTTTASTIVRATGSWLTDGYRVGDVVTITGDSTSANNNLRLRVVGVSATTLTLAGTPLTANATARAFTVTRLKKLITSTSPVRHSYSVEQYDKDIDASELFLGCRLVGMSLNFQPNGMATVQYTFAGLNRDVLGTAASPYFTTPALTTGLGLVADDSAIRYNGAEVATFTGFSLDFQIANSNQPVIGSLVGPNVFDNDLTLGGQITALRSSLDELTRFDNETEFEVSILLQENEAAPKDCIGIFLPRVKIAQLQAPVGGGDGAKVETRSLMIGPKDAATGYDGTIAVISSSAA